jgi:PKD repeat protein
LSAPFGFELSQFSQSWDYSFHHWGKVIYETGETDAGWLPQSTNTVNVYFTADFPNGFHYYVAHFSGGPFDVSIVEPNILEDEFVVGDTLAITWFADQGVRNSSSVQISLSRDGRVSWQNVSGQLPHDLGNPVGFGTGFFDWTISSPISTNCRLRIIASDMVNNTDTIVSHSFAIGCAPVANFVTSANVGVIPFTITFTDVSSFATNATRIWNFGDGQIDTTQSSAIQHTYTTTGLRTVSLTVTNNCGSDSITAPNLITANCLPALSFQPESPVSQVAPFSVNFVYNSPFNLPPGTVYSWDFGDGQADSGISVSHTYTTKGVYDVTMSINVSCGANTLVKPGFITVLCCDTPGDYDNDGIFNIADVTAAIARVFSGGGPPFCNDEADMNGDNDFNITDVTYGIARLFSGGPAPICGTTGT